MPPVVTRLAPDTIYTRKVNVEMTEAEWIAYQYYAEYYGTSLTGAPVSNLS